MTTPQICFEKGKGRIAPEGLRCGAPRKDFPERICNKLLCKRNTRGQIAGDFRCERCGQDIELTIKVL